MWINILRVWLDGWVVFGISIIIYFDALSSQVLYNCNSANYNWYPTTGVDNIVYTNVKNVICQLNKQWYFATIGDTDFYNTKNYVNVALTIK